MTSCWHCMFPGSSLGSWMQMQGLLLNKVFWTQVSKGLYFPLDLKQLFVIWRLDCVVNYFVNGNFHPPLSRTESKCCYIFQRFLFTFLLFCFPVSKIYTAKIVFHLSSMVVEQTFLRMREKTMVFIGIHPKTANLCLVNWMNKCCCFSVCLQLWLHPPGLLSRIRPEQHGPPAKGLPF